MPDDTISIAEMADLRQASESWMMDRCNIFRSPAGADDAYGGRDAGGADTQIATNIHCTVESGAEHVQERALLAKIENIQAFTVTLPANTDIAVRDHIVLTSRNNDRLRVEAVLAPESWEVDRRIIASELE